MPELFDTNLPSTLIPTKVASDISGYNADYLARLCREKKIDGVQVGRSWLINRASLESFVTSQEEKKRERAEELRTQRGKEYRRAQKPIVRAAIARATAMQDVVRTAVGRIPSRISAGADRLRLQRSAYTSSPVLTRPLTAAAVALAVVAGSAFASTNDQVLATLTGVERASVRVAMQLGPSVVADGSSFRITEEDNASRDALASADEALSGIPSVPSARTAADAFAYVGRSASQHDAYVVALMDDARMPFASTASAQIAGDRIASLSRVAHDPIGSAISAYVTTGMSIYDAGERFGAIYLSSIAHAGEGALAIGAGTRDTVAIAPRASGALLASYERGVYAWNDASPKVAGTILTSVYDVGHVTQTAAAITPSLARIAKDRAAYAVVDTSLAITRATEERELALLSPIMSSEKRAQPTAALASVGARTTGSSFDILNSAAAQASRAYSAAARTAGYVMTIPLRVEDTVLGTVGYAMALIDGTESPILAVSSIAPEAPGAPSATVAAAATTSAHQGTDLSASAISFVPVSWQRALAHTFHGLSSLAHAIIGTGVRGLATILPGGTFTAPTLTLVTTTTTETLPLPVPADSLTRPVGQPNTVASTNSQSIIQNIVNNYYPQTVIGGSMDEAVLAIVRPFVRDSIEAALKNRSSGGGSSNNNGGGGGDVNSDGAVLTNVTITGGTAALDDVSADTGTFDTLTITSSSSLANVTATSIGANTANITGTTSLGTTTVNGDLNITGTISAGSLAVTSLSSNGAVIGPYFMATDTAATSSFPNLTATNLEATNASTTNASSTNFFANTAHIVNGVFDSFTSALASITNLSGTNLTYTNATTTNLSSTNATLTNAVISALTLGGSSFTSLLGDGLVNVGGVLTLDRTGDWTGTFDGREGTYYLANSFSTTSANYWLTGKSTSDLAEGTNLYYTDARSRAAISSNAVGLSYDNATGVFSLTPGYVIPTTASTTAWDSFYQTPSTRIIAGNGLAWNGNTLNVSTTTFSGPGSGLNADFLDGLDSTYFLANSFSTTSANYWLTGKTTSDLAEGTNLYFTNTRADARVAAATSTIRGMFSGTAPIQYDAGTGNFSLGVVPIANGGTNATSQATNGIAYFDGTSITTGATFVFDGTNVGIGTTTPASRLSVDGDATITGLATAGSISTPGAADVGSLTIGSLSGFLKATAGAVSTSLIDLSTDVTSTLPSANGGTGFSTYDTGDLLYADSTGMLARLPIGAPGQVLKVQAGLPFWGQDQTVGMGGSDGIFATSSGRIYPLDTSSVLLVGTNSTSTANSIFEVNGQQYISTRLGIATTSPSAALSVGGNALFSGNVTATAFIDSNITPNSLVYADANREFNAATLGQGLSFTGGTLSVSTSSLALDTTYYKQNGNSFGTMATLGTNDNNALAFETNNSTKVTILPNGNVGVGTTTPGALLDVQASYATTGFPLRVQNSGYYNAYFQGTNPNNQASYYLENDRGGFASYGGFLYGGSTSNIGNLFGVSRADRLFMFADGPSNLGFYAGTLNAQPFVIGTNNLERARVDASGNFGIGTTSPFAKLSVAGDVAITGGIYANNTRGVAGQILQSTGTGIQWVSTTTLSGSGSGFNADFLDGLDSTYFLANSFSTTSANYWLTTKSTSDLAEGANLYFTNARADARIAAATSTIRGMFSGTAPIQYDAATGNFSLGTVDISSNTNLAVTAPLTLTNDTLGITQAGTASDGYLSAADWNSFNSRLSTTSLGLIDKGFFFSTTSADYWLTTKSTSNLAEGTNLYYTDARARAAFSETVPGLDYDNATGILSLTTGYTIPFTASTTEWNTAYQNRITNAVYPLQISANTISLAFGTTTANSWSQLQQFNGGASTTQLTVTGPAYLATTGGNVGIGTTSPYAKLSVAGDIALTGGIYDSTATRGTAGQILQSTGTGVQWVSTSTAGFTNGTVTSVNASGGTTGFTFTGGPITTNGTLTLSGTLGVANGGTNATAQTTNGVAYYDGTKITTGPAFTYDGTNVTLTGGNVIAPHFRATDTANAPGFSWASDATTGMYHAGSNLIGFATGGIGRAFIDGNGYFGIGSSTPSSALSVEGDALINGGLTANSFTLGADTITDFTGAGLTNIGGALSVSTTTFSGPGSGLNADLLDGLDSTYFLANSFSTTSANYWLTTKTTDNLAEGTTNQYFTPTRARGAISLTTTGTSGAATYNGTTGVLNIPQYQAQGSYITALTGDGTATGPGSATFTLATVNPNVGTYGSSTAIPYFTVNGKGLITAAGTNPVVAPAGTLTGTTLASNVVTSSLTSLGTLTGLTVSGGTTLAGATSTSLYTNIIGLNGDYLTDFTGAGLVNVGGALSVSTTTFSGPGSGLNADYLDGYDSMYFLANSFSTTSANYWLTGKSTSDLAEGTNLYYTDARARAAFSETVPGLDYDNTTGVLSLTAGYTIPTTASTTAWDSFYQTPSTRITAGYGLSWNGNTLNVSTTSLALDSQYFQQNGNSFGTLATLGTNDNNALAFETNNGERMRILPNGNVGIGTTSPQSLLAIRGTTPVFSIDSAGIGQDDYQIRLGAANASTFDIYNQTDNITMFSINDQMAMIGTTTNTLGNSSRLFVWGGDNGANIDVMGQGVSGRDQAVMELESADYATTFVSTRLQQYGGLGTGTSLGFSNRYMGMLTFQGVNTAIITTSGTTTPLIFGVNDSEKMRLTNAGNLGIGTTSPYARLSVTGDLALTGGIYDNTATRGTAGQILQSTGTGVQWVSTSTLGFASASTAFVQNGNSFGTLATLGTNDNNALAFETNNSEAMRILTNGNVGIGVTAPGVKLEVNGGAGNTSLRLSGDTDAALQFTDSPVSVQRGKIGYDATTGRFRINSNTGIPIEIANSSNSNILLATGGGNVGVGTTTPSGKLAVESSTGVPIGLYVNNAATGNYSSDTYGGYFNNTSYGYENMYGVYGSAFDYSESENAFGVYGESNLFGVYGKGGNGIYGEATTNGIAVTAQGNGTGFAFYAVGAKSYFGGNVGIGTTSPLYSLDVANGTGIVGRFSGRVIGADAVNPNEFITLAQLGTATSSLSGQYFQQNGNSFGTLATLGTNDNNALAFKTNLVERMRILTNGNVGIGTTTPQAKFNVYNTADSALIALVGGPGGAVRFGSATNIGSIQATDPTGNASYKQLQLGGSDFTFQIGGVTKMVLDVLGNVGIGTTTPSAKLAVAGTIYASSTASVTIGNASNVQIAYDYDPGQSNGCFYDDGTMHNAQVYAYKTITGGQRIYSQAPASLTSTSTDQNTGYNYTYSVTYTWDAVSGADGYRVLFYVNDPDGNVQNVNYNRSLDTTGTSVTRNGCVGLNDATTVTPTSGQDNSIFNTGLVANYGITASSLLVGTTTSVSGANNVNLSVGGNMAVSGAYYIGDTLVLGRTASSTYIGPTNSANTSFSIGTTFNSLTTGSLNFVAMFGAGSHLTSGSQNIAFGVNALSAGTTANGNVAIGTGSLYSVTTAVNNIGIGQNAGGGVKTGNYNIALGTGALAFSDASYQVAIGYQALGGYTSSTSTVTNYNTAVGAYAIGNAANTGSNNSAFGSFALSYNTSGVNNSAFGLNALRANNTGSSNSAFGVQALSSNTSGTLNNAFGNNALLLNTTGYSNGAFGYAALNSNSTGYNNNAFGGNALYANTIGNSNSVFGDYALSNNTSGSYNVAVGQDAGRIENSGSGNVTSSNSLYLGAYTKAGTSGNTNEIVIGYSAVGNGSNSVTLGNTAITKTILQGNVGIGTTTPQEMLSISANGLAQLSLENRSGTTRNTQIIFRNNNPAAGFWRLGTDVSTNNNSDIFQIFRDGIGAVVTANTTGNVGIGTSSPSTKFVVANTTGPAALSVSTTNTSGNIFAVATSTGGTYFAVAANGVIKFPAYGAGTLTTDASGNITASSDERLKKLDGTFVRGLEDLKKLSPILYHWNEESKLDQTTQYAGFSAQNVQGAIPEAVDTDPRGFLTLQDRPILAASVNAIKELAGRTDTLSTTTSSLATRMTAIEADSKAAKTNEELPKALTATQITAQSMTIAQGVSAGTLTAQSANVDGTVSAARYIVPATAQSFSLGSTTVAAVLPSEALTAQGSADLYKLASYNLASIQMLQDRFASLTLRIDDLDSRLAALETSLAAGMSGTAEGAVSLTATALQNVLKSFGIIIHNGITQFQSVMLHQLVFTQGEDGSSAAGSMTIPAGQTEVVVENSLVTPNSKVFITFTSSVEGSWYLAEKKDGSFKVKFSNAQSADTSFDYFIVQTEGQVASVGDTQQNNEQQNQNPTPPADGSPVVSLKGEAAMQIAQGASWTDPGATATAADGTDLTSAIAVSGNVDAQTPGTYTITYNATDAAGKTGEASRVVTVLAPSVGSQEPQNPPASSPVTTPMTPPASDPAPATPAPEPAPAPAPQPTAAAPVSDATPAS